MTWHAKKRKVNVLVGLFIVPSAEFYFFSSDSLNCAASIVRLRYTPIRLISAADLGVVRVVREPPKLNVKTYNKRVVKKKSEPTQLINISFENDISLCLCTRKQQ